jgi:hypothetical protein
MASPHGYSDSWDETVTAARLRPRPAPPPDSGATITPSATSPGDAPDTSGAATTPSATLPAGAPDVSRYHKEDAVLILYGKAWYPGRVLRVEEGEVWVHYDGYSDSWDEKVGPDRLRPTKRP